MRIRKEERIAMIHILMQNHDISYTQASKRIDKMNGELEELAKKVRKRQKLEKARKAKDFSKEFTKLKGL